MGSNPGVGHLDIFSHWFVVKIVLFDWKEFLFSLVPFITFCLSLLILFSLLLLSLIFISFPLNRFINFSSLWAVVVVKESACPPFTPTIRVRIPLISTVSSVDLVLEKNKKEAGVGPFLKNFSSVYYSIFVFWSTSVSICINVPSSFPLSPSLSSVCLSLFLSPQAAHLSFCLSAFNTSVLVKSSWVVLLSQWNKEGNHWFHSLEAENVSHLNTEKNLCQQNIRTSKWL